MAEYSLSDIRSIVDSGEDRRDGTWGASAFLWIILIFLFFLAFSGNGVFGGNRNTAANGIVDAAAIAAFTNQNGNYNLSQVERDILTGNCSTQKEVLQSRYDAQLGFTNLSYQNQQCCCDLKTAIHSEGEATRALINANTIQDLRDQLNAVTNQLSNTAQNNTLISALRPYPIPSYLSCSPYMSSYMAYAGLNGLSGITGCNC